MSKHSRVQFGYGLCTPEGWLNVETTSPPLPARLQLAHSLAPLALGLSAASPERPRRLIIVHLLHIQAGCCYRTLDFSAVEDLERYRDPESIGSERQC
jgi:hypothetical protein